MCLNLMINGTKNARKIFANTLRGLLCLERSKNSSMKQRESVTRDREPTTKPLFTQRDAVSSHYSCEPTFTSRLEHFWYLLYIHEK